MSFPVKYKIPFLSRMTRTDTDGRRFDAMLVRASDLPIEMSYEANARNASLKSPAAKEMLETLRTQPELFLFGNNGIRISANAITIRNNMATVECLVSMTDSANAGHGIANGGHSYYVLMEALTSPDPELRLHLDDVHVLICVSTGLDRAEAVSSARRLNTAKPVRAADMLGLEGVWAGVKQFIKPAVRPHIRYRDNDPFAPNASYRMDDVLKRIAVMSNTVYPLKQNSHPNKVYSGTGAQMRALRDNPDKFKDILPLLPDIFKLEELIVNTWPHVRTASGKRRISLFKEISGCSLKRRVLLSGGEGPKITDGLILPILAAFRAFIQPNGTWLRPVEELWQDYGLDVLTNFWALYTKTSRAQRDLSALLKKEMIWMRTSSITEAAAKYEQRGRGRAGHPTPVQY